MSNGGRHNWLCRIFLFCSSLFIFHTLPAGAATVTGSLKQITGKPVMGNTFVRFELKNCGSNIPRVAGINIVVPPKLDVRPNALGQINAMIVNNEMITCDVTGNTFYTVSVWNGDQRVFEKDYVVSGARMDLSNAVPLQSEPTVLVPHFTYDYGNVALGDMFWASGVNRMSVFAGNKSTTTKILMQTGDGTSAGAPYWAALPGLGSTPTSQLTGVLQAAQFPALQSDLSNTEGSLAVTVTGIQGQPVAATTPGTRQALVYSGTQYQPQAIVNAFNARTGLITPQAGDYDFSQIGGTLTPSTQLPNSGAGAGTYGSATEVAQVTVDAKGRVTGIQNVTVVAANAATANALAANPTDCSANQFATAIAANGNLTCSAIPDNNSIQKIDVWGSGTKIGTRKAINFIPGTNVSLTIADNAGSDRVDVTINSAGGGGGGSLPAGNDWEVQFKNGVVLAAVTSLGWTAGTTTFSVPGTVSATQFTGSGAGLTSVPLSALPAGDYSSKLTSGTYSIAISGNAATVTNGVYTDGSYSDPTWLTLTKAKVGLGSVENTALSTWTGSANITTIGTLVAGTVPWARITDAPATFSATPHTHPVTDLSTVGDYSSKITSGTYSIDITGNAGSVSNGVYTNGSYSDPTWLTLSKAKVGLGSVENTALSTWAGSANITTVGTLAAGSVPWSLLTSVPASFAPAAHTHPITDLSTVGDYSSKITSGTYAINVTGSAGSVAWANIPDKPASFGAPPDGADGDLQLKSGTAFTHISGFNWSGTTFAVPGMLAVTPPALSQSYSNPGSSGDRRSTIAVTALAGTFTGGPDPNLLVDGSTGSQANLVITGSLVGNFGITFDFGGAFVVTEATHTQNNGLSNGNFQWRGTNDSTFVSWTNIGSGFVLGGATSQVHSTLNANAVAYRYYQLKGVSGSSNGSGLQEFTFKLGSNVLTLPAAAYHGSVSYDGHVATSGKFIGSAAGLTDSTVPITALVAGDYSGKITSGTYGISVTGNAGTVGTYTAAKIANAYLHESNVVWKDFYMDLPTGLSNLVPGVLAPKAAPITMGTAYCSSDNAAAQVQLRRSDGQDIYSGNITCNGTGVNANAYASISTAQSVGLYVVSGATKSVNLTITYSTVYP